MLTIPERPRIITYPHSLLKTRSRPVEPEEFGEPTRILAHTLTSLIYRHESAVGLSAPQIGVPVRFFSIRLPNDDVIHFANPTITETGDQGITSVEGCLSLPGVIASLKCRPEEIELKAQNLDGEEVTIPHKGYTAIICHHEIDHLNGLTLFDRMGRVQKRMRLKRYMKRVKGNQ